MQRMQVQLTMSLGYLTSTSRYLQLTGYLLLFKTVTEGYSCHKPRDP